MLNDLAEIIEIESVLGEADENAPFGEGPRKALDWFLAKGKEYGMAVKDYDGYCGHAEIGEGERLIGLLCHLDIVPAGGGWTFDPYKLTLSDGMAYGRGVMDNKGPLVVMLRVLKSLKENGLPEGVRVRIIAGCNEETGSKCLKHYAKVGELPEVNLVPDADFPVINSEKGILHAQFILPVDEAVKTSVRSISGGGRPNVIPQNAVIEIIEGSPLYKEIISAGGGEVDQRIFSSTSGANAIISGGHSIDQFSVEKTDGGMKINSSGTAGHAMDPDSGDNAFIKLFDFLSAFPALSASPALSKISDYLLSPLAADKLGIYVSDPKSGELTMNVANVEFSGENVVVTIDFRLPVTADKGDVIAAVKRVMPDGTETKLLHYAPNLYISEDSALVKTLLGVYERVTGEKAYTVQTGGGTYARELPNSIAFGATFPDTKTNIHNADECVPIEHLERLFDIYHKAVKALSKTQIK